MKEVIQILMRRDGISEEEARNLVEECRAEIYDVINHGDGGMSMYNEVVDIIADYLSLEPDYLECIL